MADIVSARPASGAPIATAWGAEVHDQLEGIQTGSVTGLAGLGGNSGSGYTLTFPKPYAAPPIVMCMAESNGYNASSVNNATTTTVILRAYNPSGTAQTSLAFRWIAIGTLA